MAEALSRSHWEGFPWSERGAHDLHCAPNREIGWQLRVLEISPGTVDNSTVAAYVQTVDIGSHLLKELPRTLGVIASKCRSSRTSMP